MEWISEIRILKSECLMCRLSVGSMWRSFWDMALNPCGLSSSSSSSFFLLSPWMSRRPVSQGPVACLAVIWGRARTVAGSVEPWFLWRAGVVCADANYSPAHASSCRPLMEGRPGNGKASCWIRRPPLTAKSFSWIPQSYGGNVQTYSE